MEIVKSVRQSIMANDWAVSIDLTDAYEGESISNQPNLFLIEIHLFFFDVRGMFEMNCLLSSSSISTRGTIKTNTYLYRAIQYLHNGI